jgi:DNA invertase Pin-like site-specific DNA recombinase
MCVCHHCDTSICVNPNHLFVGTNAENEADKVKKGRQSRGEKHRKALQHLDRKGEASPTAKLNWEKVKQIRASKESQRKVAKKYGVSQTVISNIKLEKTWRLDNGWILKRKSRRDVQERPRRQPEAPAVSRLD